MATLCWLYRICQYFIISFNEYNYFSNRYSEFMVGNFMILVKSWYLVFMMNYDITEKGMDWSDTGVCPSTHSHVKCILFLLSNIVIQHQNYHDTTNIAKLPSFVLYHRPLPFFKMLFFFHNMFQSIQKVGLYGNLQVHYNKKNTNSNEFKILLKVK